MVRQRYEMMDSDRYDDHARYQQHQKPANAFGGANRYEAGRRSLQSLQSSAKARILKVYKNGEPKKGVTPVIVSYLSKNYQRMEPLLDYIAIRNKTLVKYLFKWPSGELVYDICEIDDDIDTNIYVCSDKRTLNKRGCYGGIHYGASGGDRSAFADKYSRNSHGSRGMIRSQKQSPTAPRSNGSKAPSTTLNVLSNKTGERINLFKDPNSKQSFEDFLMNIQDMLDPDHPPVHTLYNIYKPQRKINSISSLNRALQSNEDTFLACGRYEEPNQNMLRSRDTSPMRNGSHQRQKIGNKQNGHYEERTRQSNGYGIQQGHVDSRGRPYQRHHEEDGYDDDIEQDEYDQEASSPPPRGGARHQDQSPRRDNRQPPNRQSQRRDDEDESPQRDKRQVANRRSQRQEYDDDEEDRRRRGNRRESEQQKPRRQQTPPPRKHENRRGDDRDDDHNNDDDDDDDRERDHPSDEEMQMRIEKMEEIDPGLDKRILY